MVSVWFCLFLKCMDHSMGICSVLLHWKDFVCLFTFEVSRVFYSKIWKLWSWWVLNWKPGSYLALDSILFIINCLVEVTCRRCWLAFWIEVTSQFSLIKNSKIKIRLSHVYLVLYHDHFQSSSLKLFSCLICFAFFFPSGGTAAQCI